MQVTGNNIALVDSVYDHSFNPDRPEAYNLFVLIRHSELQCAVADHREQTFVAHETWQSVDGDLSLSAALEEIIRNSALLSASGYRNVICSSAFYPGILVPSPLFDNGSAEMHYTFSQTRHEGYELLIDKIRQAEAVNIYEIPSSVIKLFNTRFPDTIFNHTSTSQVGYLLSVSNKVQEPQMVVTMHSGQAEVCIIRSRQIELCNWFSFESPEELVYYLLFICEQLHLNPETVELLFTGETGRDEAAFQLAEKYLRNTALIERPSTYQYPEVFDAIPAHRYFQLFSQLICVS